jgi:DNA-3-methyladenine glycosylase II
MRRALAQPEPGDTGRLESALVLARHLDRLVALDPRLAEVRERAGPFEIRRTEAGFAGLARAICGQQLSTASASAIWLRFAALEGALQPEGYLALDEATVRGVGFSLSKFATLRGVADAMLDGRLDPVAVAALPAEEAVATLCTLKGIGPWTAEIYLMFAEAHPDIFPAGDLALQQAVAWAFGLDARPRIKNLIDIAAAWSPFRSTAALLFWRYYRAVGKREGLLI